MDDMQTVEQKILERLYRTGRGSCFSGVDFLDLGGRSSVDKALASLLRKDKIRRLRRGLYDYPHFDKRLGGRLGPDLHRAAAAFARKNGMKIQASGAWAANLMGLSTQVPAKMVYLTNGKSRTIEIDDRQIQFVRASPKRMQEGHPMSCAVANALRWLGQPAVDEGVIATLRRKLDDKQLRRLSRDMRYAEDWIFEIAQKVSQQERN